MSFLDIDLYHEIMLRGVCFESFGGICMSLSKIVTAMHLAYLAVSVLVAGTCLCLACCTTISTTGRLGDDGASSRFSSVSARIRARGIGCPLAECAVTPHIIAARRSIVVRSATRASTVSS